MKPVSIVLPSHIRIHVHQPFKHIGLIPYAGNRETLLQYLLGPAKVVVLPFPKPIAVRPSDPAPAPLRINRQPLLKEIIRLPHVAHLRIGVADGSPHVLDGQLILLGSPLNDLLAKTDFLAAIRGIVDAGVVEFHFHVLHPVADRLCSAELLVKIVQELHSLGVHDGKNVFPDSEPQVAGFGGGLLFSPLIAILHRIVDHFKTRGLGIPPFP